MIKAIPTWDGYFVSDDGKVFSCRRGWHELKAHEDDDGYLRVSMSKHGKGHTMRVHRLVLMAFRGVSTTLQRQARHLDGTRTNNRPRNLDVGTPKDNYNDRVRHGRGAACISSGSLNGRAKFTEEIVREACRRAASGELYATIRKDLGIGRVALQRMLSGENWGHLGVALSRDERNQMALSKYQKLRHRT